MAVNGASPNEGKRVCPWLPNLQAVSGRFFQRLMDGRWTSREPMYKVPALAPSADPDI